MWITQQFSFGQVYTEDRYTYNTLAFSRRKNFLWTKRVISWVCCSVGRNRVQNHICIANEKKEEENMNALWESETERLECDPEPNDTDELGKVDGTWGKGGGQVGDTFLRIPFPKVLTFGTLLTVYIHKNNKIKGDRDKIWNGIQAEIYKPDWFS